MSRLHHRSSATGVADSGYLKSVPRAGDHEPGHKPTPNGAPRSVRRVALSRAQRCPVNPPGEGALTATPLGGATTSDPGGSGASPGPTLTAQIRRIASAMR